VDQPSTALDDVLAWLRALTPVERARVLAVVLDTRNAAVLRGVRYAAILEALDAPGATRPAVAAELGVTPDMMNKLVTTARKHAREVAAAPSE
jgi:hypothetical protein